MWYNSIRKKERGTNQMAKAQGTIYAVVTYPKSISDNCEVHVYSKTTSNRAKMEEYYNQVLLTHGAYCNVALVTRESAKRMHDTWYNAMRRNYGHALSREDKKRSVYGHKGLTEREYRRKMWAHRGAI
jgi:hypothetical protein